jgi:hypothetical protein
MAKQNSSSAGCLIAVLTALALVIALYSRGVREGREQVERRTEALAKVDPKLQQDRRDFIDRLIARGIFYKVERPADLPHVWVTPLFLALGVDEKERFLNVVYALHYPDGGDSGSLVVLKDSRTGNRIGTYSQAGLSLN